MGFGVWDFLRTRFTLIRDGRHLRLHRLLVSQIKLLQRLQVFVQEIDERNPRRDIHLEDVLLGDVVEVLDERAKAREAGFDMKVTLEAVVGFVNRNNGTAVTKITTPARLLPARRAFELTANDKRFLRSLRIGADEAKEPTVEGQN